MNALEKEVRWNHCEELFERYRRGDANAAREFFIVIARILQGYYRVRIRSEQDAEDLSQAAILKLHYNADSFEAGRPLKPWIFTIAHRCLIDHYRGLDPEVNTAVAFEEQAEHLPADENTLSWPERSELRSDLESALLELESVDRSVVYLYTVVDLSMREVADVLGLTEAAAKLRASRSYAKLRRSLSEP
jgi:RNA polymerase sigma-70 factor (ECF subfamily)